MTPADDPLAVAAVIARTLEAAGARYSIGGSIASSMAGEPRSTPAVDVVIDLTAESVQGDRLDVAYLQEWAMQLGVSDLLDSALTQRSL